jgi:ubiquinone/menaquinone biosynthesis C-methylase UbiE
MTGQAAFVGAIPENYDRGLGPLIFLDYADDIARRAAAHRPGRVLEIAAGTGIVSRRLRDLLPAATTLTASDLNPPMLEWAARKFKQGEWIEFRQADAMALPFADAAFDAIVCQFGVMFYPDKDKSYREAMRVLAPGGRYHFSVWDAHRHNACGRITHETVAGLFPADPPGFFKVPYGYHRIDPIKDALEAAGFGAITASVVSQEKEIPDAAAFARGFVFGSPLFEQIRERGGVSPEAVHAKLTDAFRREFGADPGRMRLQAIVFEARKP